MGNCGNCCGHCGSCSGGAVELTVPELRLLQIMGQLPFLPVIEDGSGTPICLESTGCSQEETSKALLCLQKKQLIALDLHTPLKGFHSIQYDAARHKGSMALTQRGQQILELLDIQGIDQ